MAPPEILRSLLFVPADSPGKLAKARRTQADALVLDWEDAVLHPNKPEARTLTMEFLRDRAELPPVVLIRVNPVASPYFEEDAAVAARCLADGILLSKCRSVQDMSRWEQAFGEGDREGGCSIFPMVESAEALLNAPAIATSSPRVAALVFGAEDFSADMGITRTAEEWELLYARSALVTACRAAARQAIDSACLGFRDTQEVQSAARRARNLGFTGKLAIHPAQVPILNEVFSPSESEIEDARSILEAFSSGSAGVIAVEGRMVDEAVLRRARRILRMAEQKPNR